MHNVSRALALSTVQWRFTKRFATRHKREKHGGNEEGGHSHHKATCLRSSFLASCLGHCQGQGQDSMEDRWLLDLLAVL